jgi:histidine triad (HIT) family protein
MSDSCLFCKIVKGTIPAKKVYEDDAFYAFDDINPQAPCHVLVIPKEHIEGINDVEEHHAALLGRLFVVAKSVARQKGVTGSGYRLVVNTGAHAGQTVFHVHMHVVGGREMGWPPG